jgi:uncharacterized protein (TIGR02466 family)
MKNSNNIKNISLNSLKLENLFSNKRKNILFDKSNLVSLIKDKKYKEAYALTKKNLGSNSKDSDLWYLMAVISRINNDINLAFICLKNGLSLNPNDIKLIVLYCMNCIDKSLFKEALEALKKIEEEESFPEVLNAYALVYRGLEKNNLALEYFIRTLRLDKSVENLFYNYAVFLSSISRHRLALKYYKKFIKLNPNSFDALFNASSSYISLRNFEKAKEILLKLISFSPKHIGALLNLAIIHNMRREIDEAKAIYIRILKFSPSNIDALINLANLNYNIKNYSDSVKFITQALKIDSQNIQALNVYAASLYELNDYENSIIQSNKVISLDKSNLIAIMNLINAYYFIKKWDLLKKKIEVLRSLDPCNPLLASLEPLFSYDHDLENKSKFIKNPFKYIKQFDIKNYELNSKDFIKNFLKFAIKLPSESDPEGKTTVNGLQTPPTVFEENNKLVKNLSKIIENCIIDYRNFFKESDEYYIDRWPSESSISGWIVYLKNQGMQTSHNHLSAWLSGVVYLKVPETKNFEDGAIKFSLHGYDYPTIKQSIPEKIIKPTTGSIILFPSSLYHSTIPFESNDDRISLAFDLMPGKLGRRIGLD